MEPTANCLVPCPAHLPGRCSPTLWVLEWEKSPGAPCPHLWYQDFLPRISFFFQREDCGIWGLGGQNSRMGRGFGSLNSLPSANRWGN